jgi:membrane-bound lytic murein transglycosylase A
MLSKLLVLALVSAFAQSSDRLGFADGDSAPQAQAALYRVPISDAELKSCLEKATPRADAEADLPVGKFEATTAADCITPNIMDQKLGGLKAIVERQLAKCANPVDAKRKPIVVKIGERNMTKETCIQANQTVLDLIKEPKVKNTNDLLKRMAEKFDWYRYKSMEGTPTARENVKFTGYNSPEIKCMETCDPAKGYKHPIYAKPSDPALVGLSRAAIVAGGLEGKGLMIACAQDKLDVFFLHIEGSGTCVLPNGRKIALPNGGKNGHAYRSISKIMTCVENVDKKYTGYAGIREYFKLHPGKLDALLNLNPSYIYFGRDTTGKQDSAVGFGGAVLVPRHSVAVDVTVVPMGTLLFFDGQCPVEDPLSKENKACANVVSANDRGGAILGPRVDVFWGSDKYSEIAAGRMGGRGQLCAMLPKPKP